MKVLNKVFSVGLSGIISVSALTGSAFAIETDVIDEKWGKPTVVYGGGLSSDMVTQTQSLLSISNTNNVYEMYVYGTDLDTYLGTVGGDTNSLISSVMVKKTDSNGVVVNIKTPDNITKITKAQYENAAITAGVYNCEIDVASVSKVTGESALTGVYKAFTANGETLDTSRTTVAQEELETTNEIAEENANNSSFDSEALDAAIVEVKKELAELKDKNGSITTEDITNIVNNVVNNYNLGSILSADNINALINFFGSYVNTSAIDSDEVISQLNQLANSFSGDVTEIIQQAKDSGWWDKIINFFTNLWNSITGNQQ